MLLLGKKENSAGYDLHAAENKIIKPCKNDLIRLELCIAIVKGFYTIIEGPSSLAHKKIIVHNSVIDSDYRGIVCVINVQYNSFFSKKKNKKTTDNFKSLKF